MPADARSQQDPDAPIERWDATTELLAQLVEVSSVIATGGRVSLKEPVELPRPDHMKPKPRVDVQPAVGEIDPAWTRDFLERRRMAAWGNTAADDVAGDADDDVAGGAS